MSDLCEHETFRDICGICHRDGVITALRAEVEKLRTEVEKLRAALRQIAGIDVWDNSEQGYVDKARAALEEK